MTDWRPTATVQAARNRAAMLRRIRRYFEEHNVLEVDTPALSPYAVSDTQIESLEIRNSLVSPRPMYLHTSPEFCMKRLLAAGYPDIYSICRVFRDGESGQRHQPEFTMIEWYRLDFDLRAIIDDTLGLIKTALDSDRLAGDYVVYDYQDVFVEAVGVNPLTADIHELVSAAKADERLKQSIGDERDDWLDLVLATRVAPAFATDQLTVLRHYPANQAALARLCPDDSRVADRFEVFLGTVELANGYVELTDADEHSRRILADNADRRRRSLPVRPRDRSLLAALRTGLPCSSGVAIGLERLQMIHDATDDIREVISFSFEAHR